MKMVHSSDTPNTTSAFCAGSAEQKRDNERLHQAMTTVCIDELSHMSRMERAMTSALKKRTECHAETHKGQPCDGQQQEDGC